MKEEQQRDAIVSFNTATDPVEDVKELAVGGGNALAYSHQSPDKQSGNEDTVGVFSYGADAVVLAVADGAGGLPAGQKASQTAVTTLGRELRAAVAESRLLRTAVLNGIEQANQAIIDLSNGSATTLTVVTVEERLMRSFHVGDSMAVVTGQRGALKFQTVAHSPVGFAVEAGFLDEREAMYHIDRNLVSNFLGAANMRIDVSAEVRLAHHDTIVLASDGLADNVHLDEILEHARMGPLGEAIENLATLAGSRMRAESGAQPSKPDDLSIVLFRKPIQR